MDERLRILLIDDDEEEYFLLKELVSGQAKNRTLHHYDLDWVSNYEEAVRAFLDCQYDLYLVDYQLGAQSGLDLLRETAAKECSSPVIMLTGQGSYETDVTAMQLGAADYLEKSQLTLPLLERSIRYAIERKQDAKQLEKLVQERTSDLALMKKQAQELAALQKATTSLLHTLDISRLMGQILDAAQEAIPSAEQAWLHLVERQQGRGKTLTEIPLKDSRIHRVKPSLSTRGPLQTVSEGRSLLIADLQMEPLLLSLLKEEEQRTARAAMIVPLVLDREVLGALSLAGSLPSLFSEADLQLVTSFAATATAAIHNAILYSETQSLAATDPLTGQLNRRSFFQLGQREVDRFVRFGRPLSWIMFDVDWFKQINDSYGHSAGDQVLTTIAERCCRVIRHVDIFGRYGGDEFVVLLPETDHQMAREVAERLRTSISESPMTTNAGEIHVSISIGVTEATPETADVGLLLNKADQALYKSKRAGRNTITVVI
ncbi:MAG TPA: diguanylate cyclase [Anaerolineales bacterium]|nr:diguanylate cyclase [Anaerolineales bacterium]